MCDCSKWQKIETAPKDEPILATNINYAYRLGRCEVVFWDEEENGWYSPISDLPRTWLTHWMPLPPAPSKEKL